MNGVRSTGLYHYRHGEERGGKIVYPVVSTRIVLSRIRVGCGGRRYYTSAGDGEHTNRLSAGGSGCHALAAHPTGERSRRPAGT